MKRTLLFLLCGSLCLTACKQAGGSRQSLCTVNVKVDYPEYTEGNLKTPDGKVLDTLTVNGGQLTIQRSDSASMPYVVLIHLRNVQDSIDWLDMPVVIEGGEVNVGIGEYITTTGTPLNAYLQEFLNGLQAVRSGFQADKEATAEEVRQAYSAYYKQQILGNAENVVGKYIYKAYGNHLLPEDRETVENHLSKN